MFHLNASYGIFFKYASISYIIWTLPYYIKLTNGYVSSRGYIQNGNKAASVAIYANSNCTHGLASCTLSTTVSKYKTYFTVAESQQVWSNNLTLAIRPSASGANKQYYGMGPIYFEGLRYKYWNRTDQYYHEEFPWLSEPALDFNSLNT